MDDFALVVGRGNARESLEALRGLLAKRLMEAKPGESAALARQLADVLDRIAALPGEEKSGLDDLTARRATRKATIPKRSSSELESRKGRG